MLHFSTNLPGCVMFLSAGQWQPFCIFVLLKNKNNAFYITNLLTHGQSGFKCSKNLSNESLFVLGFYGPVNSEVMSSRSVNSGTVPGQA